MISTFLDFAHYIVFKKEHTVLENTFPLNLNLFEYKTVDKEQKTRTLPEIIDLGSLTKSLKKGKIETGEHLSEGCHGQ